MEGKFAFLKHSNPVEKALGIILVTLLLATLAVAVADWWIGRSESSEPFVQVAS